MYPDPQKVVDALKSLPNADHPEVEAAIDFVSMFVPTPQPDEKPSIAEWLDENPGALVVFDNDEWWVYPAPPCPLDELHTGEWDRWLDAHRLSSDHFEQENLGYLCHSNYGAGMLLSILNSRNINVESV